MTPNPSFHRTLGGESQRKWSHFLKHTDEIDMEYTNIEQLMLAESLKRKSMFREALTFEIVGTIISLLAAYFAGTTAFFVCVSVLFGSYFMLRRLIEITAEILVFQKLVMRSKAKLDEIYFELHSSHSVSSDIRAELRDIKEKIGDLEIHGSKLLPQYRDPISEAKRLQEHEARRGVKTRGTSAR